MTDDVNKSTPKSTLNNYGLGLTQTAMEKRLSLKESGFDDKLYNLCIGIAGCIRTATEDANVIHRLEDWSLIHSRYNDYILSLKTALKEASALYFELKDRE